jgi:Tfp pilus assembly protein PilX
MSTSDTMAIRPLPQLLFPDDLQFWFETLRWLGLTAYGGADFGEVVTTAQRISAGLYDSWYEQWAATAARVEAEARAQLAADHQVSATTGCCAPPPTGAARSSSPAMPTRTRVAGPPTTPACAVSPTPPR